MRMEAVLDEIEKALRARGISARQASIEAVGNDAFVKRMRSGQVPTTERLAALCEVLELEFYVGPPRDSAPVDEERLGIAVQTAVRALDVNSQDVGPEDLASLVVAVYGLIGKEGSANTARVRELVRIVGGEQR